MSDNIDNRLENIEEILKMLLINSVLNGDEIERLKSDLLSQAREFLSNIGLSNIRLNYIEGKNYIFAEIEGDDSLPQIRRIFEEIRENMASINVVLVFDRLHHRRRKAMEEEKISYYLKNGEMRIF